MSVMVPASAPATGGIKPSNHGQSRHAPIARKKMFAADNRAKKRVASSDSAGNSESESDAYEEPPHQLAADAMKTTPTENNRPKAKKARVIAESTPTSVASMDVDASPSGTVQKGRAPRDTSAKRAASKTNSNSESDSSDSDDDDDDDDDTVAHSSNKVKGKNDAVGKDDKADAKDKAEAEEVDKLRRVTSLLESLADKLSIKFVETPPTKKALTDNPGCLEPKRRVVFLVRANLSKTDELDPFISVPVDSFDPLRSTPESQAAVCGTPFAFVSKASKSFITTIGTFEQVANFLISAVPKWTIDKWETRLTPFTTEIQHVVLDRVVLTTAIQGPRNPDGTRGIGHNGQYDITSYVKSSAEGPRGASTGILATELCITSQIPTGGASGVRVVVPRIRSCKNAVPDNLLLMALLADGEPKQKVIRADITYKRIVGCHGGGEEGHNGGDPKPTINGEESDDEAEDDLITGVHQITAHFSDDGPAMWLRRRKLLGVDEASSAVRTDVYRKLSQTLTSATKAFFDKYAKKQATEIAERNTRALVDDSQQDASA